MKITSVTFRANIELKPFQHAHIEATACVDDGEKADDVLTTLKKFVAQQLNLCKFGNVLEVAKHGKFLDLIQDRYDG